MGVKLWLILLLILAVEVAPHSATLNNNAVFSSRGTLFGELRPRNLLGRSLLPRGKYLSYAALKHNSIPCGRRGMSYYDCTKRKRANPYRRSCLAIHGCARFTD